MLLRMLDYSGTFEGAWYVPEAEMSAAEVDAALRANFLALTTPGRILVKSPTRFVWLALRDDEGYPLKHWFLSLESMACRDVEKFINENVPIYQSRG